MNRLEEYKKEAKPKFYELLPIFSILYEIRMSKYIGKLPPFDPVRKEVVKTFSKVGANSFGLVFILTIITPLAQVLTSRSVIKRLSE